jgi:hypothetical protein
MSRRARRKNRSGSGWWVRGIVFLLVLAIGGAAVGYGLIRSYLHSDAFRVLMSKQVSKSIDAVGEFAPLRWDGLAARTGSFEASGEGPLRDIRASDVRTEISLDGFRDGYWLLNGTSVRHLAVTYAARSGDAKPRVVNETPKVADVETKRRWLPSELRFDTVDVDNLAATVLLDDGELRLKDHRVRVRGVEGNHAIDLEVHGGTVQTPLDWLPELRLHEIKARYRDGVVFLTDADFRVFKNGRLTAAGEWDEATSHYAIQGNLDGIDCGDLLNEDWSRRLTGHVMGDFKVADSGGGPEASGTMEIRNGVLTALPLLDSLSAYADTQRFRMMTLHEARSDWKWHDGNFMLTNLRLVSEGLAHVEGTLAIGKNGELDGHFRLGLAPGTLSRIPGAETVVFQRGENQLLWTTLRITGTIDDPREDLSERLIAAAGIRMFEIIPETGERVLRHTRTLLGDLPPSAVDTALDLLGVGGKEGEKESTTEKIIRGTGNILDSILGGSEKKDEER